MSVQTHTATSRRPLSPSLMERLRWRLASSWENPNPVWIRELRQSARLTRTPVILAVISGMVTLLIASIGGVLSDTAEPAQVGIGVFHTFFSLAFAVVTWVGPAVAAATIASERSGRTWEALLLTGLSPATIARGKFLAALTYVFLYVVMLAPVGGLSFLFGGVTPTEVLVAFVLLGLFAGLSVAFGLAMSSKFASPAAAILVTLFVAVPVSMLSYLAGGVALSFAIHELWSGVTAGAPVWLPTAYVRADFGLDYFVVLLLLPPLVTLLPAWLFYEVTIANMAAPSDDRSTRLRIWMLAAGPLLALGAALARLALGTLELCIAGLTLCWMFFAFAAFLVAGEPLGPSPRVEAQWARLSRGAVLRWLGPGVAKAGWTVAFVAVVCISAVTATGAVAAADRDELRAALAFGGYALGFALFLIGFATSARASAHNAAVPRVLLAGMLFLALFGPYIAMAIGGILTDGGSRALLMAAPSPAFAFVVVERLQSPGGDAELFALAGAAVAVGWGLIGLGLLARGSLLAARRRRAERNPEPAAPAPPVTPEQSGV